MQKAAAQTKIKELLPGQIGQEGSRTFERENKRTHSPHIAKIEIKIKMTVGPVLNFSD